MNAETEEETRLGYELQHLVSSPPFRLDQAAIERRAHRSRQHQLLTRGLAGVVALGVVAAGGAVIGARPGAASSSVASSSAGPVHTATLADVEKGITTSLDNIDNYVIKDTGVASGPHEPTSDSGMWVDARTGDLMETTDGFNDWTYNSYGSGHVLELNQVAVYPELRAYYWKTSKAVKPLSEYPLGAYGDALIPSPQQFKQLLNGGTAKIIGYTEINGHKAVGLSVTKSGVTTQLWADTTTYQVVRTVSAYQLAKGDVTHETNNYAWLPRSASLLKQMTTPVIPSGFKQLARLP
ncbi:MAG TPA: hypothetical protein VIZ43_10485 [Trebonia sp.]